MRLDKFLKVSRIIKRRTVANEAASAGRISINGKVAKPASEVKPGDTLEAWGAMPGAKLTGAELLCRLRQKDKPTAIEPPPSVPEPEPEPTPELEPDPEPEPASEPVPELSPALEPALDRPADSASLADDFGLLVRHAGEVYEDLLHPPLPEEPETPAEDSAPDSAPQTPKGDWFSETEQLLSRLRRRVRSRGTPPN